jgi:hypothetical protein
MGLNLYRYDAAAGVSKGDECQSGAEGDGWCSEVGLNKLRIHLTHRA